MIRERTFDVNSFLITVYSFRTEAGIRKLEQAQREQLHNVHKHAIQLLRTVNRFKTGIAGILEKEISTKAAEEVRKIQDFNTEEVRLVSFCHQRCLRHRNGTICIKKSQPNFTRRKRNSGVYFKYSFSFNTVKPVCKI